MKFTPTRVKGIQHFQASSTAATSYRGTCWQVLNWIKLLEMSDAITRSRRLLDNAFCKVIENQRNFEQENIMMTASNGNISALLTICAGNSPVSCDFPTQRAVTRNFDVFLDLRPNKLLSKQSWGWWFETPSHPLWRHRNDVDIRFVIKYSDTPSGNNPFLCVNNYVCL